nr:LacI family DNA-binding transcriptional regulator [Delftia acidovorans]
MDNTPPPTPHQRITVHDVARVAGVSIGTVSRVVNGAATVKPAARERVNQAIAELGWAPSVAAQAMRGRPRTWSASSSPTFAIRCTRPW